MIVDFHTHIFPPRLKKERDKYVNSDPCFAILYSKKEAKLASAEELISSMDHDGVDVSVILNIGWTTHELCVETNDYILESVSRYPKRLIGFCAVQPLSIDAAANEIERCVKNGACGIGELRPDTQLFSLEDEEIMVPFTQALQKHSLPVLLHTSEPVGHVYPGKGNVTPDYLYPFFTHYPEIKIVLAHWGGGMPFYALMPEVKKAMNNVYFDTAASPFLYSPQIYRVAASLIGAEKILLGSDFPLLAQQRLIQEVKGTGLSDSEKLMVLGQNGMKLLNRGDAK